jgi:hypothetical protein
MLPHQQRLLDSQHDTAGLNSYIADKNNPQEYRNIAELRLKQLYKQQEDDARAIDDAKKLVSGTPKEQSDLIRKLSKPSDEGSRIKAYLYNRLGLTELARDEQDKILGKSTKIQAGVLDGKNYTTEIGPNGAIVNAYEENGKQVDKDTLARLNAGSSKFGTHAYGFTGGGLIIPEGDANAGQEYRQRTNSITGKIENIITTGPNAGNTYTGPRGTEKRVESQYLIGNNNLIMDLMKKHNGNVLDSLKEFEQLKGPLGADDRATFLQKYGYQTPAGGYVPPKAAPAAPAAPEARKMGYTPEPQAVPGGMQPAVYRPESEQGGMQPAVYRPGQEPGGMQSAVYRPGQEPGGMVRTGGVDLNTPIASLKQQKEISTRAAEEGIKVQGKRSEGYNDYLDKEVAPESGNGAKIAQVRRNQFNIFNRPGVNADKIFGLYNAAAESPNNQSLTIVRDIIGGQFRNPDDVSARIAQLGLDPATRSALEEYNNQNQIINTATLKANSGPGSVSDAEQKANRAANVDPTKVPALGAYNSMASSQFSGDKLAYKGDWAAQNADRYSNRLQLERAWKKESQRLDDTYLDISKKRLEYINQNGNNTAAVKEGYRRYPIPEYDARSEKWIKTDINKLDNLRK